MHVPSAVTTVRLNLPPLIDRLVREAYAAGKPDEALQILGPYLGSEFGAPPAPRPFDPDDHRQRLAEVHRVMTARLPGGFVADHSRESIYGEREDALADLCCPPSSEGGDQPVQAGQVGTPDTGKAAAAR